MSGPTAATAMAHAEAAHIKIEAHEDLCAERYAHIHTSIAGVSRTVDKVLKVLAWGGSTVFVLLLGVLGFFMTRAMSNNDNQLEQLRQQIQHEAVTPLPKKQPAVVHIT
jgi:hypothetical protein